MKQFKICSVWLAALALSVGTAWAQNQDHTPKKGAVEVGASLSYNTYHTPSAPSASMLLENAALSNQWTSNPLMVGVDASWFFSDKWSIQAGGGFAYTYKPGYSERLGVTVDDPNDTQPDWSLDVPTYRAVANASDMSYSLFVGANHHWTFQSAPNLVLYAGARIGFSYGLSQAKYNEASSMGVSVAERSTFRVSAPLGVKYYVARSFFVGAEVSPVAYGYNLNTLRPQEGLASYSADSHEFSFLAAPTLKIGFRF